jgi:hypothetical protein
VGLAQTNEFREVAVKTKEKLKLKMMVMMRNLEHWMKMFGGLYI